MQAGCMECRLCSDCLYADRRLCWLYELSVLHGSSPVFSHDSVDIRKLRMRRM